MPSAAFRIALGVVAFLLLLALAVVLNVGHPVDAPRSEQRGDRPEPIRGKLGRAAFVEETPVEQAGFWAWASPPEVDRGAYRDYRDGRAPGGR
jgi:hypothetical protein